jgi:receptor protein-tyrosine kinase
MDSPYEAEAVDFGKLLGVLRRRLPLIALCAVVVATAAFAYSRHQAKEYTATASLVFSENPLTQQVLGLTPGSSSSQFARQASNVELVGLGDMAAKTASGLGGGLTEQKVAESLSIAGQGESDLVAVSATATSPALAAQIANTYTRQFVAEQKAANHRYFRSALVLVEKQVAALPAGQRFGTAAAALQDRAQTLRLLDELHYGDVQLAGQAVPPTSPSSPKTLKNTLVGGMLGLLIGLGVAFLFERLDRERRSRESDELERIYGRPVLGAVPKSAALGAARAGDRLSRTELEVFQLICARMRFFNPYRDLRTVLVASAAPGDGATTVARRLAEAAARMGSRTLLVEADLRKPMLAQQIGLSVGPGLADVLMERASLRNAVQSRGAAGFGAGALDVLVGGSKVSANAAGLIESVAMDAALAEVRESHDLVIIDAPPPTLLSDAFGLLGKVDGVLIVSSAERSGHELAKRLSQTLERSRATPIGIVVNRVRAADAGHYADVYGDDELGDALATEISANGIAAVDARAPIET